MTALISIGIVAILAILIFTFNVTSNRVDRKEKHKRQHYNKELLGDLVSAHKLKGLSRGKKKYSLRTLAIKFGHNSRDKRYQDILRNTLVKCGIAKQDKSNLKMVILTPRKDK